MKLRSKSTLVAFVSAVLAVALVQPVVAGPVEIPAGLSWVKTASDPGALLDAIETHPQKLPTEFEERLEYVLDDDTLQVIVALNRRDAEVERFVQGNTTWLRWYFDNPRFLGRVTADQFAALLESSATTFVEPDYPIKLNMASSTVDIRARSLNSAGTGVWSFDPAAGPMGALRSDVPGLSVDQATGKGVTVAITDSGIDKTFRDFGGWDCEAGPYQACESRVLRTVTTEHLIGGDDPGESLPTTDFASGHGTHVAGTIGGNAYYSRDGDIDAVKFPPDGHNFGVAPQVSLINTKNGDSQSAGLSSFGLEWQLEHAEEYGIRVSSNSWGCVGGCTFNQQSATGQLFKNLYDAGVVVVFAAGNDGGGQDGDAFSGNAQSPYVVGVAAYTDVDNPDEPDLDNRLADFSSRGSDNTLPDPSTWTPEPEAAGGGDGERRPDVAAPGVDIWSAGNLTGGTSSLVPRQSANDVTGGENLCCTVPYRIMSGTSMATPHVAGAAALLASACPTSTPLDIMRGLMAGANSAKVKPTTGPGLAQPFEVGYGALDVRSSVDWLLARNCDSGSSGGGGTTTSPTPTPTPTSSSSPSPVGDVIFEGEGFIEIFSPFAGVTLLDFELTCGEPLTQGVDGYVFELLEETTAREVAQLVGTGSLVPHDLDLYFYDSECVSSGDAAATAAGDEIAFVPPGTKWIVAHAFLGLETTATLKVYDGEAVTDPTDPPPPVALGTTTEFTADSASAGQYSDSATIAARLADEDGNAMSGEELAFELTGASGSKSWTATTDENGVASKEIALDSAPDSYSLTTRYAGEVDAFEPSADLGSFVIEKEDSKTVLTISGNGANRAFSAKVTEVDGGTGLAGVVVEFFQNGKSVGTATTNANGVATLASPPKYNKKDVYEAVFGSNAYYLRSAG